MISDPNAAPEIKRLSLRSWRRGTKEMDLILGRYADARLPQMDSAERAEFEALMDENDQDLYAWVSGQETAPDRLKPVINRLRIFHGID